jgi:hypothetical protein
VEAIAKVVQMAKGSSGKRFKWQNRKIIFLLEENKINHLKTKEE